MNIEAKEFNLDYRSNTTLHSTSHFHTGYEICFFEVGHRSYAIGQNYYNIYPNTVVLIEPYVQHSTKGSVNSSRCVVYFTTDFLKRFFTGEVIEQLLESFKNEVVFLNPDDTTIYKLFHKMRKAYEKGDLNLSAVLLAEILLSLSEVDAEKNKPQEKTSQSAYIIPLAISYIGQNIGTINNVEIIATYLNISTSYLSALFKDQIGTPIKQYIIKVRINHAVKLLLNTNKSITAIAMECGFNSSTHFCNTFKKHMNTSPADYRKQNKE